MKVRPISIPRSKEPLDSSTGLSYNGTTHVTGTASATQFSDFVSEFRKKGVALTLQEKKNYVKFEDTILKLLPKEDIKKARIQMKKWREEIES